MRNFTLLYGILYVAFPEESVAGASPFSEAIAAAVMLSNGFTLLYRPEDRLRWGFFSAMVFKFVYTYCRWWRDSSVLVPTLQTVLFKDFCPKKGRKTPKLQTFSLSPETSPQGA